MLRRSFPPSQLRFLVILGLLLLQTAERTAITYIRKTQRDRKCRIKFQKYMVNGDSDWGNAYLLPLSWAAASLVRGCKRKNHTHKRAIATRALSTPCCLRTGLPVDAGAQSISRALKMTGAFLKAESIAPKHAGIPPRIAASISTHQWRATAWFVGLWRAGVCLELCEYQGGSVRPLPDEGARRPLLHLFLASSDRYRQRRGARRRLLLLLLLLRNRSPGMLAGGGRAVGLRNTDVDGEPPGLLLQGCYFCHVHAAAADGGGVPAIIVLQLRLGLLRTHPSIAESAPSHVLHAQHSRNSHLCVR